MDGYAALFLMQLVMTAGVEQEGNEMGFLGGSRNETRVERELYTIVHRAILLL